MEFKIPRPDSKTGGSGAGAKKPPSRLQKRAPGSLQLDAKAKDAAAADAALAWETNAAASAPIPLLSPLVLSPAPLWDASKDGSASGREEDKGDGVAETRSPPSPPEGWRHPALAVAAMESASLVPFFEFQCSVVHNVH